MNATQIGTVDAVRGWMLLKAFCQLSGYTELAVRSKLRDGIWLYGREACKAPDGRIHINWEAYQAWVRATA